ncbi:MAG TPA: bifunctional [glutamine synthetase] adenylyltransferase/[glutamine synthetase]-adenylyl-L-tyrosine phosphorylase [Rhizomicrobium sp.]|nr:bifunctional [glutamine synthetase] adenylyltransferase/[glutamine synthetase]-adenylyl-L-tyrosine phosphorylase [Rhizomicrobium sp.]
MNAFAQDLRLPEPFDIARAERSFAALESAGVALTGRARAILNAAFGNSPFLSRLARRESEFLPGLFAEGPERAVEAACDLALGAADAADEQAAMAVLRGARRRAALAIALADIAGVWTLDEVMAALSRFADAGVKGALRYLLRDAAGRAGTAERGAARLEAETGLVVLAMGKFGAFELNYSSDIDLVVFYDPARFPFRKRDDPRGAAVDIVRGLVKLLSEVTADGYVFRVDLRLRPDAGATQVAISTDAAEAYYEGMGQNWERAAMIKSRACAGDAFSAARFLKAIEPFVWRRNLDYAAIEDIHSIKRQIHAHGGHGAIAVAGHNIKLGRGGIREIEFFAQTQQLIAGGRNPNLRPAATMAALDALCARGLVTPQAAAELKDSYRFLRRLEHRLQMIEDEQTHTLPRSAEELAHVACFAGFGDTASFGAALKRHLETVQGHYARLFEREAPLASAKGSLVFTGVEDDPETLRTLSAIGFRDAHHVANAIRGWHHGRIRATRSVRARELLTKLVPALLEALAASADPDAAFSQFDRFVSNLPAGVQLFSLFLARPELLRLVASIAGAAPRLAAHLARAPGTLDALLDADFLKLLPDRETLAALLRGQMALAPDYEEKLDAARRFAKEQIFRAGVQIIECGETAGRVAPVLAGIAECIVAELLAAAEEELAASAGRVPGGRFAVIAMGKLGGREMTAESDLDLIFVYDAPEGREQSDGPRPLPVTVYYARLAQRLIAALTVLTAEGGLYEVDMRLRPTGNKGPVAVSLESFRLYHETEAWTWERLALTRARAIAGPRDLRAEVERVICSALTAGTDTGRILRDAREMREKLRAQFPGRSPWDLKFAPGGLVDIEFVAQTLQLCAAHRHRGVLDSNTIATLEKLKTEGVLGPAGADALIAAASFQQALMQVLRIAVDGPFDPQSAGAGLKSLLARAAGCEDFALLERRLAAHQSAAHEVFLAQLGAAAAPAP